MTTLQELAEIKNNAIPGVKVSLISDEDIYKWRVVLDGPEKTAFAVYLPPLNLLVLC